jgi:hypothetical protein
MTNLKYSEWQRPYQEALAETNPQRIVERVHLAEASILSRMVRITLNSRTRFEAEALDHALGVLAMLRRKTEKSKMSQRAIATGFDPACTPAAGIEFKS